MPSRAKTVAASEPAGPPPTIKTVQLSGMDMVGMIILVAKVVELKITQKHELLNW